MELSIFLLLVALLLCVSDAVLGHGDSSHHGIDPNAVLDEEHIKEHLAGKVKTEEKLSNEEKQFHYFKQHDYDDNSKLDGIEIISAILHAHKGGNDTSQPVLSDAEITSQIDSILLEYDSGLDGYIDYREYKTALNKYKQQNN